MSASIQGAGFCRLCGQFCLHHIVGLFTKADFGKKICFLKSFLASKWSMMMRPFFIVHIASFITASIGSVVVLLSMELHLSNTL